MNLKSRDLVHKVREALTEIIGIREAGGRSLVSVPVQYPSGALSVVEVEHHGRTWWISDMGHGLQESEYVSADAAFDRAAKAMAKAYGVEFDGHSIFALKVPEDRLVAGIVAISNASVRAAIEAIRAESERKLETKNEEVYEKLSSIFGKGSVSRKLEIEGAHAMWEAHNVVRTKGSEHTAIFELMTHHPHSISAKYLMFSDLQHKSSLSLNAVVSNPDMLDRKGQMIAEVATIIRIDAPDSSFKKLAIAA